MSEMIEITGADLDLFLRTVYAMSRQQGMGVVPEDIGELPEKTFTDDLILAWKRHHENKERAADFPRKLADEMGLICSADDLEYYQKKGIEQAREHYDNRLEYLYGLDYFLGRSCKMSMFVRGYEKHRIFINPSWLDHSEEQFKALLSQFAKNIIPDGEFRLGDPVKSDLDGDKLNSFTVSRRDPVLDRE